MGDCAGRYQFGARKILLKLCNQQHQSQILVRVGGGWLGLADFIKQYYEQEAEKERDQFENILNIETRSVHGRKNSYLNSAGDLFYRTENNDGSDIDAQTYDGRRMSSLNNPDLGQSRGTLLTKGVVDWLGSRVFSQGQMQHLTAPQITMSR